MGHFSVSCKFKNVADQFVWAFTGVYGPNLNKKRRLMWEELIGLITWWDVPWCLGGDFNIIRFPSERMGAASFTRAMNSFSDFVSLHGLMDIHMEGGLFTWSNSPQLLDLIGSFSPSPSVITSLSSPKKGCLEFFRTIFPFCWRVGAFGEEKFRSALKICG